MIESEVLIHELQLGEQLGKSVQQSRRADFSLMLAMLTDDVREQSQFRLPETEQKDPLVNTETLRAEFDLPEPEPLALSNIEEVTRYNQALLVSQNLVATLKLENAVKPLPLCFKDNDKYVPIDVKANTSLPCQVRQEQGTNKDKLAMNANGWLKAIKNSLVSNGTRQQSFATA